MPICGMNRIGQTSRVDGKGSSLMSNRVSTVAAFALSLTFAASPASADCVWGVDMAERHLADLERAVPLAADRGLPLGPGGPQAFFIADRDFSDRSRLAYGDWEPAAEENTADMVVIEARLVWARDRLATARRHAMMGDLESCQMTLGQARDAISGAREVFR